MHDPELITVVGAQDENLVEEIDRRLGEALRGHRDAGTVEDITITAHDAEGRLVAGLVGYTSYGWLLVKMLWVADDTRRQGFGTRLMAQAEHTALSLGCHAAWLDTSNDAAAAFYEALGYRTFGLLENGPGDRPPEHRRTFMAKRLTDAV